MVAFRYRDQERRNIAASEARARNAAAVDAAVSKREAAAALAGMTKEAIGLGNVDNTSDADKTISTATQAALDEKVTLVEVPATAASAGTAGQIAFDATHFYACVATDTWVRTSLATW